MPLLKFKHIVSFSSEDSKHPASNILKPETYYKWKCSSGKERQASVLLQLEKSTQINGVDIGNNGSAFVEVLVGRSSWSPDEEFKVLLVASSFMTPVESKSGKELYRVRMFGAESLNKSVTEEKWDQVKVVCTQPYNQSEGYGLSFLKLSCPQEKEESKPDSKIIKLGRFKLRSNSDDEEETPVSAGSFFQKRMNITPTAKPSPKPSVAATARNASNSSESLVVKNTAFMTKIEKPSNVMNVSVDKRQEVVSALMKGSNQPTFSDLEAKNSHNQKKVQQTIRTTAPKKETPKKPAANSESSKRKINNAPEDHPSKKIKASTTSQKQSTVTNKTKKEKVKKKSVAFSKILEGVTFALSGYQNPERGDIRDNGLSMGAKYEPNWNHKCTHLVCAFSNTPKFQQVKGKGKIVTKKWFEECKQRKRRTNTKKHRIDGGGDSSFESSSDEDMAAPSLRRNKVDDMCDTNELKKVIEVVDKESSECDTEDELEKIRNANNSAANNSATTNPSTDKSKAGNSTTDTKKTNNAVTNNNKMNNSITDNYKKETEITKKTVINKPLDEYDGTTEEEDNSDVKPSPSTVSEMILPQLPNFFDGKTFFFYGELDKRDKRLLSRYITAYAGTIENYMTDDVDYVISSEDWDENFEKALQDKSSLVFLRPKWVIKCHEEQKLIPFEKFTISP